ncbi:hypothetical protein RCL1_005381 [Eukaryota sp. TZLM3-RCL]
MSSAMSAAEVSAPKTLPIFQRFPNEEWLLELEELQYSPSIEDGYSFADEWAERSVVAGFIQLVVLQLGLPSTVGHTACVYFHRFFCRWSLKNYSPLYTTMACLFVASKNCDFHTKLEDIIKCCTVLNNKQQGVSPKEITVSPQEIDTMATAALRYERQLLYTLAFKTEVALPYQFISDFLGQTPLIKQNKEPLKSEFVDSLKRFLTDSFKTPLPLLYPAEFIAAGVIWVTCLFTKLPMEYMGPEMWYLQLHPDLLLEDLDRIGVIMLKLYEK